MKGELNSFKQINPVFDNPHYDYLNIPTKIIQDNIDCAWLSGYIEGVGSFRVNKRLQAVFEIGQKDNYKIIHIIHKYFKVPSKIKYNSKNNYTTLSTKHPRVLKELEKCLNNNMLGIKSFEYRV